MFVCFFFLFVLFRLVFDGYVRCKALKRGSKEMLFCFVFCFLFFAEVRSVVVY